jgi:3-phenylpropionate/trans-cinnamate dioxygenase ferredoxin reductase component
MSAESILIVGAGLAGVTAAGSLREAGFSGRVVLIGDEREVPYDRPPLSKSVLVHDEYESLVAAHLPEDIALRAPEQIALRPAGWFEQQHIELRLGERVASIAPAEHRLKLDSGDNLDYSRLILATGARVRRLPAAESGPVPVMYLRTLRDSLTLRKALRPGRRIVLLGGGVIGMEVAASAALRDCDVTVVELAPRIMSRALCEPISQYVAQYHRAKGVKLKLDCAASHQADGAAPGLQLRDGSVVAADVIIVGIGIVPNVELAQAAGLRCADGIVVNEFGATSAPDIFAAGDAVRYPDSFFGRDMRSENWMHAQYQAIAVAKNAAGASVPYVQTPHMWSDQYDLKIQVTGRYDTAAQVERGDRSKNKFMLLHLEGDKVVGATGINESRDMKFAQRLIEAGVPADPAKLVDPNYNLKKAGGV